MKPMIDQKVGEILRALVDAEGVLKAEVVVEAARPEDHYLHKFFTWDDAECGTQHRLAQARQLIRCVEEYREIGDRTELIQCYVSLTPDRALPAGGYRPLEIVLSVDEMRSQLVADALGILQHFQRRYAQYQGLAQFKPLRGVFKEVSKLDKKTNKKPVDSEKPDRRIGTEPLGEGGV